MINETEKEFFDAFGIECNILQHQQFNYAQVPRGLEFFKTREKFVDAGMIKISYKKLTPTPGNDCIYWGECHYPTITDRILLELIEIIIKRDFDILKLYKDNGSYYGQFDTNIDHYFANYQKDTLKDLILDICQHNSKIFYHQVRALFGEKEET